MKNPEMTIIMETGAKIVIELYPQYAPNSVASVVDAAKRGAYNGQNFYRVVKDFVLQTEAVGDYYIPKECASAGVHTDCPSFTKGIVGMASDPDYSSGTSFFIMTGAAPRLDGDFAVIGKVIAGMEEVMRINEVPCDGSLYMKTIPFYRPLKDETMVTVTVDTFGREFPQPVKVDKPVIPNEEYIS